MIDSVLRKNQADEFLQQYHLQDKVVPAYRYSDNFERMAGLIKCMDMYVGPDSSGTHVAAALGKPILGIYGPFRSRGIKTKRLKNILSRDVLRNVFILDEIFEILSRLRIPKERF